MQSQNTIATTFLSTSAFRINIRSQNTIATSAVAKIDITGNNRRTNNAATENNRRTKSAVTENNHRIINAPSRNMIAMDFTQEAGDMDWTPEPVPMDIDDVMDIDVEEDDDIDPDL